MSTTHEGQIYLSSKNVFSKNGDIQWKRPLSEEKDFLKNKATQETSTNKLFMFNL